MKRSITPEARQAMQEAREHKAEVRTKRLTVGQWIVFRADQQNIVLQKGEDGDPGYYPDVPSALRSLLRKLTDPTARQELAEHVRVIERAEAAIVEALHGAGGLQGLFVGDAL